MHVGEVVGRLAGLTHPERAAPWDAVGLQVGDPDHDVLTLAVVHEVTEGVTRRLVESPVDLVVSYHPLLFRPVGRLVADRSPGGRAVRLLQAGVAVAVTHTDYDVMRGGMADAMADALGLTDVVGFAPVAASEQAKVVTFVPGEAVDDVIAALSRAGAGQIGDYEQCAYTSAGEGRFVAGVSTNPTAGVAGTANREPEVRVEMMSPRSRVGSVIAALVDAHPYEEPAFDVYPVESNHALGGRIGTFDGSWDRLVTIAVEQFQPDGLRLSPIDGVVPRRVAVSPGAGESRIGPATAEQCDVLLSGDISHHRMVEANDRGLSIIDVGHGPSERPGVVRLTSLVADLVSDTDVDVVLLDADGTIPH